MGRPVSDHARHDLGSRPRRRGATQRLASSSTQEQAEQPAGAASHLRMPRWVTFGVLPFSVAMVISMGVSAYLYLHG